MDIIVLYIMMGLIFHEKITNKIDNEIIDAGNIF